MRNITGLGWRGMSNTDKTPARLTDDSRFIIPRLVLNANVLDGGVVRRRAGYTRKIPLAGCHSLWGGSVMFCVAQGQNYPQSLYRIEGARVTELCEVPGPKAPMNYLEVGGEVYLSNP